MIQKKGLSAFWLKIFAIVMMTCNHLGHGLSGFIDRDLETALIAVGGATYMIMAFLLTEGFRHTRNVYRYFLRLFLFALLSQPAYSLHPSRLTNFNVIFTLFLALLAIYTTVKVKNPVLVLLIVGACVFLSGYCDWPYVGVLIALAYYWIPERSIAAAVAFSIAFMVLGAPALRYTISGHPNMANVLYTLVGCTSGVLMTMLYNGKRGGRENPGFISRYFFYLYYPAHLAAIAFLVNWLYGVPLRFTIPIPFN